ncbi:autotransporter outer membrane beta-barrel domain-containing protein, partial [Campylobacter sp. 2018MI35]|nr:autotransporter outer membrane beta-barrel domain-containing protein [Campylobacter sp. 2018MI34]
MISSDNGSGVYVGSSTIENFTNKGTIKTSGTAEPNQYGGGSIGISLRNSTISNFANESSISGKVGIKLSASSIENFTNKGTIESTSNNNLAAGIALATVYSSISTINTFTNEGTIQSSSNGILVEAGNKIGTLTNKGTIDAKLNGISFYDHGDVSGNSTNIGKITIESGGVIKAGNNGINIDGSGKDITGEGIDVKGRLEGGNAGIYIGAGKQVNTSITVSGTIQGNNGGIINTGTIGQKDVDVQTHGITIENGGTITSKN